MKTAVGSFQVETWWDRHSRNWITQLTSTTRGGSPLLDGGGESEYSGTRRDADLAHGCAVERAAELEQQSTRDEIAAAVATLEAVRG